MVRIRLRRNGLKGQASYRIIAADKESPRDGRFLEILGSYNPRTEPFDFKVKEERVYYWMKNGGAAERVRREVIQERRPSKIGRASCRERV